MTDLPPGPVESPGILDTSVIIEFETLDQDRLPIEQAITAVTLGELSVGPLVAADAGERARRQQRLQVVERHFADATLPYDATAARVFGRIMAGSIGRGRTSGARVSDYQIAAIAIAHDLPLYTINVDDFTAIEGLRLPPVPPAVR